MHQTTLVHLTKPDSTRDATKAAPRLYDLSDEDLRQLHHHLQRPDITRHLHVLNLLRHKVKAARSSGNRAREGVVSGSSRVTWSADNGPAETGLLSHRARTGMTAGVIPVCSNLGAALIGLRVGERVPYLCADRRIASLTVLQVAGPA